MRQVVLGAVVAFALTILVFSFLGNRGGEPPAAPAPDAGPPETLKPQAGPIPLERPALPIHRLQRPENLPVYRPLARDGGQ